MQEVDGVRIWFFDGLNNPGFSGGPAVFCRSGSNDWHVAAIIAGYLPEKVAVEDGAGAVPTNTGIIVSYQITHATDAIDAYLS